MVTWMIYDVGFPDNYVSWILYGKKNVNYYITSLQISSRDDNMVKQIKV